MDIDFPASSTGQFVKANYKMRIDPNYDGCTCCTTIPHAEIEVKIYNQNPPFYGGIQTP